MDSMRSITRLFKHVFFSRGKASGNVTRLILGCMFSPTQATPSLGIGCCQPGWEASHIVNYVLKKNTYLHGCTHNLKFGGDLFINFIMSSSLAFMWEHCFRRLKKSCSTWNLRNHVNGDHRLPNLKWLARYLHQQVCMTPFFCRL